MHESILLTRTVTVLRSAEEDIMPGGREGREVFTELYQESSLTKQVSNDRTLSARHDALLGEWLILAMPEVKEDKLNRKMTCQQQRMDRQWRRVILKENH